MLWHTDGPLLPADLSRLAVASAAICDIWTAGHDWIDNTLKNNPSVCLSLSPLDFIPPNRALCFPLVISQVWAPFPPFSIFGLSLLYNSVS